MAATPGSVYQLVLTQHIANNPPNAYPQTAFETDKQYFIRMASQGLKPDIGATEADSAYLTRLASYNVTPVTPITASYAVTSATAGSATSATTAVSASFATTASWAPTNA